MPAEWPWMRFWAEARTDKKLAVLTDAQHRVWLHLLCFASEQPKRGEIHDKDDYELSVECASGDVTLLRETLQVLERLRIVRVTSRDTRDIGVTSRDARDIAFLAWEKRQYDKPSDLPDATAERKRRQREKAHRDAKKEHPLPSNRGMSRGVTRSHAPELEEEGEREGELERIEDSHESPLAGSRQRYSAEFENFWHDYGPTNGPKKPAHTAWERLSKADRAAAIAALPAWLGSVKWQTGFKDYPQKYLSQRFWEGDPLAGAVSPNGVTSHAEYEQTMRDIDATLHALETAP